MVQFDSVPTYSPRHICWDSGPSLPFNAEKKNWTKHDSFIACARITVFNATLGMGESIRMIEQLNENLSLSGQGKL